jgi:hypothetical protein
MTIKPPEVSTPGGFLVTEDLMGFRKPFDNLNGLVRSVILTSS